MTKSFWWDDTYFQAPGLIMKCVCEWEAIRDRMDGCYSHKFWVLDYSCSSYGEWRGGLRREWTPFGAGVSFLIPPGCEYQIRGTGNICGHCMYIGFYNGEAAGLDKLITPAGFAEFRDPESMLRNCLSRAADLAHQEGRAAYWRVKGMMCEIAGLLHAAVSQTDGSAVICGHERGNAVENRLTYEVDRFLSANLCRRLTLREIASAVNVSISSLTHSYARETGESALRTHMATRVNRAKDLLLMGEAIKDVANDLGFFDVYHFSRVFKTYAGMPPAKFRSAAQKAHKPKKRD